MHQQIDPRLYASQIVDLIVYVLLRVPDASTFFATCIFTSSETLKDRAKPAEEERRC